MMSSCFLVIYIPKVLLYSFLTNLFYKFYLSVPGAEIIGISMLLVVVSAVFCSGVVSLQHGLRIISGAVLHLLRSSRCPKGTTLLALTFIETSFLWEFPGFVRNIILSFNLAWNTNLGFGVTENSLFQLLIFLLYQWVDLFLKKNTLSLSIFLRFSNTLRVLYVFKGLSCNPLHLLNTKLQLLSLWGILNSETLHYGDQEYTGQSQ